MVMFSGSVAERHTLAVMRAQYLGSIVFNAGFFYYLYFAFASIRRLARLPQANPSRRLLLPYTIALLIINTGFAITQNIILEAATIEGPWGSWTPGTGCNPNLVLRAIFVALPIFLNDVLFLYRAAVLVQWQFRILLVPCLLYLASIGFGVYGLVNFHADKRCTSTEGMPPDLIVTVIFTALLNLILGGIIIWKLYYARRATRAIGQGKRVSTGSQQQRYVRIASFISESALLWIVTAVLHVSTAAPTVPAVQAIAPFFELLFEIATILSPVLLTYQIALENSNSPQSTTTPSDKLSMPYTHHTLKLDTFVDQDDRA